MSAKQFGQKTEGAVAKWKFCAAPIYLYSVKKLMIKSMKSSDLQISAANNTRARRD